MTDDDEADRLRRLSEGRCPIHGAHMTQVEAWHETDGGIYTIVACLQPDCSIRARASRVNGPYELGLAFEYVLEMQAPAPATVHKLPSGK